MKIQFVIACSVFDFGREGEEGGGWGVVLGTSCQGAQLSNRNDVGGMAPPFKPPDLEGLTRACDKRPAALFSGVHLLSAARSDGHCGLARSSTTCGSKGLGCGLRL